MRSNRFFLVAALFLVVASNASATTFTYKVNGTINSPIFAQHIRGFEYNTGSKFTMDITAGNLIATYNDNGTADVADDIFNIAGVTGGCVGSCTKAISKSTKNAYGVYTGSGQFLWNFTVKNPIKPNTTGPTKFQFPMQTAGTLTLLNSNLGALATSTLVAKADKAFALSVFPKPDGSGTLIGEGWIAAMQGFLGGNTRFEFGPNNSVLNWDFSLIPTGNNGGGGVVPEPFTAGLLSVGLLGGAAMRKRNKSK